MKPSQIVSAAAAALLIALGVIAKFGNLFPLASIPYLALAAGAGGALATRLLPPFVPSMLPAHVAKVLSQIVGSVLAVLAFAPMLPAVKPELVQWLAFATALLGAIGSSWLPREPAMFPAPESAVAKAVVAAGGK